MFCNVNQLFFVLNKVTESTRVRRNKSLIVPEKLVTKNYYQLFQVISTSNYKLQTINSYCTTFITPAP
jgi:hypothetical protein